MATISASEARQTLPAQLDRVEGGEEVAITRHGRVIAVLVNPQSLAARRAAGAWNEADRLGDLLREAREQPLRAAAMTQERTRALVESVRSSRRAR
jgi:prevent-host-death family protein